jgi:pimeloyl-ACP methyl ester carboxylesterase
MADLAATGGDASRSLAAQRPSGADLAALASARLTGRRSDDPELTAHAWRALERAQKVARYLEHDASGRAAIEASTPELREWIGVSGEDDPPERPVNVAFSDHAQRTCVVRLRDHLLRVRYTLAGHVGAPIVLLLHGHSSRAEEVDRVVSALAAKDDRGGPKYCVISPDLPSCGYTTRLDHEEVASLDAPGVPMLAFHDELVAAFVRAVCEELDVEPKVACVAGGSMGGNLVLRLAETRPTWIQRFAAWSPASVWSALTGDLIKGLGISHTRAAMTASEKDASRRAYFEAVFATRICLSGRTQPEMWYRDSLACRPHHIRQAIADRRELYSAAYRRWHWRLAHEQLIFSHVALASGPGPWAQIRGPLLLVAGAHDNFMWTHIYERTRDLARRLGTNGVRGVCLLVKDTGHSIHDERPGFLAAAIDAFIDRH